MCSKTVDNGLMSNETNAPGAERSQLSPMQEALREEVKKLAPARGKLLQHQTTDRRSRRLPRPIPTRCTAMAYDGTVVTMMGEVTSIAGPWRWFVADYPGWGEWIAVVHVSTCEYLDR